ncbi:hypothetical protein L0244_27710, partial [bacterium]|nr:hypothetical protein [bacterium]MCI0697791.1 hypothetical protein [candidate division KSB1 bacterium]
NQTNQIQFEKLRGNNKVGNYNPAKVGSFMPALTRCKEVNFLGIITGLNSLCIRFAILVIRNRKPQM